VSMGNILFQKQIESLKEGEETLAEELQSYLDNIDKNSR